MTVGELKEKLKNISDDKIVMACIYNAEGCEVGEGEINNVANDVNKEAWINVKANIY